MILPAFECRNVSLSNTCVGRSIMASTANGIGRTGLSPRAIAFVVGLGLLLLLGIGLASSGESRGEEGGYDHGGYYGGRRHGPHLLRRHRRAVTTSTPRPAAVTCPVAGSAAELATYAVPGASSAAPLPGGRLPA
jgi:hypothetical protein